MNTSLKVSHGIVAAFTVCLTAGGVLAQSDGFDDLAGRAQRSKGRLELISPARARSQRLDDAADRTRDQFRTGVRQIAEPFVIVGRTTRDGIRLVGLRSAQGVVWVAESSVAGIAYAVEGARFVALRTAAGIQYVSIEAIKAGKAVLREAVRVGVLVIDGVEYVLVQVEDAFVLVARTAYDRALIAGLLIVDGVSYAVEVTADGAIWVAHKTSDALAGGYTWAKSRAIAFRIRRKMATSLATGNVGAGNIHYFKSKAGDPTLDHATRSLALAALKACESFNQERSQSE